VGERVCVAVVCKKKNKDFPRQTNPHTEGVCGLVARQPTHSLLILSCLSLHAQERSSAHALRETMTSSPSVPKLPNAPRMRLDGTPVE